VLVAATQQYATWITGQVDQLTISTQSLVDTVRDPRQFVTLQTRLGTQDALNEYIQHIGSALFLCPPGLPTGATWAQQLFTV
jgi:hypothetical protein